MKRKSLILATFFLGFLILDIALGTTVVKATTRSYSDTITRYANLCKSYPKYCAAIPIGKTVEGRTVWLFRFGTVGKPAILVDANIHGSEDIGSECMYLYAKWMLTTSDPKGKVLLQNFLFLVIPVIDGDTLAYKNKHGVNLNRNFPYGWGQSGSSNPSSIDYRGHCAGSEPETQAVLSVMKTYCPRFYLNTHSSDPNAPVLWYYRQDNMTTVNSIVSKMKNYCIWLGASFMDKGYSSHGAGGYAIAQAWRLGATSFELEYNYGWATGYAPTESWTKIQYIHYPRTKALMFAMCDSILK